MQEIITSHLDQRCSGKKNILEVAYFSPFKTISAFLSFQKYLSREKLNYPLS